jgi:hypothetical protein
MPDTSPSMQLTVQLLRDHGAWSAVVEHGDERLRFGGLAELMRYLERLDTETAATRTVRGLR